jgi:hypothetical protein
VRPGRSIVATLIACAFALGVPINAAFAGYGPPSPPPPGGPPGFGKIIEAKTVPPSGGKVTASVPPCVVSVDVTPKTFPKSIELVLRAFDNQGVNWKKLDSRFLCGVGVTVYEQSGVLTHEPFRKRLVVHFHASSIGRYCQAFAVADFGHSTVLHVSISGHTATVQVATDADLAVSQRAGL